ncbi:MAG: YopX family protein, partial [Minisyncoccia bacterium]
MTREIKFRYFYGGQMIGPVGQMEYFTNGAVLVNEELVGGVLMQDTGLKDKNGRPIYEGDVVALDSWNPKNMQIAFIEGA